MTTTTTVAAVVASRNNADSSLYSQRERPTPLILPDHDDDLEPRFDGRPRSISIGSDSSDSPVLSALDSSAALILVHDDASQDQNQFDFSDDEDGEQDDDIVSPIFEIRRTSIPPLPPTTVFLYLLAPFLKLGALNILPAGDRLSLKYGLPALFVLAIGSAFSRQVWYMLARYLRKADLMEVMCDTFAKARGKERQRTVIRSSVKLGTAATSSLLAILYLHESVRILLPFLPQPVWLRVLIVFGCGTVVFFLSLAQSLASKRVVFASWLSIFAYLAWLGCVIYAHAKGILFTEEPWLHGSPSAWKGIFTLAFTFATSSTLPLYASLKSGINPISTAKSPRSRSFRILSFASIFCATLLILPLIIFSALPIIPATRSSSLQISPPNNVSEPFTTTESLILPDPTAQSVRIALASLSATILLLGTPQPLLTIPALPIRVARTNINLSRTLLSPLIIILSLAFSLFSLSSPLSISVLTLSTVVISLFTTFALPPILHISVHHFKRPLNIVMPRTPMLPTPTTSNGAGPPPDARAVYDDLLQRKERALQRKQFKKRIVWDIGVWLQLGLWAVVCALALSSLVSR